MKIFLTLALLLSILCSLFSYKTASCESVLLSNEIGNSHFQSGRNLFMPKIIKKCFCGNEFSTTPSKIKEGKGKYCSVHCAANSGSRFKGENRICPCGNKFYATRWKISMGYGLYCSMKCFRGKNKGVNNGNWVGDDISYQGLHTWIQDNYGKPNKCEMCGTLSAKKYEWASIGHAYKRDISEWKRVCVSCHRKMDNRLKSIYQLDNNGRVIREFESTVSAAIELNIPQSRISSAIRRKCKGYGFYWKLKI